MHFEFLCLIWSPHDMTSSRPRFYFSYHREKCLSEINRCFDRSSDLSNWYETCTPCGTWVNADSFSVLGRGMGSEAGCASPQYGDVRVTGMCHRDVQTGHGLKTEKNEFECAHPPHPHLPPPPPPFYHWGMAPPLQLFIVVESTACLGQEKSRKRESRHLVNISLSTFGFGSWVTCTRWRHASSRAPRRWLLHRGHRRQ